MARKKWIVAQYDKDEASAVAAENGLDAFAALLLCTRGITESEDIDAFFGNDDALCDPFDLVDMESAVEDISDAIDNNEKIAVYGDYDADGVTATALLVTYLKSRGADVISYIPDRNTEGYGLNIPAVDKLHSYGVRLIITVDNGVSAYAEAERIYELGMRLVVTDHHTVGEVLPRAQAVVNPHRPDCESEFRDWAGVGVAFKLVCALEGDDCGDLLDSFTELVAIGTVADIVPMKGENRVLVRRGLRLLNSSRNAGINALKAVSGVSEKNITAGTVAFSLVPRINAIGRMGKADEAYALLAGIGDCNVAAADMNDSNANRRAAETKIMQQAIQLLEEQPLLQHESVLVLDGENWHPGVIGIVASRITDRYGKPCIIITSDGITAKGSGRSIPGFSLYNAISSVSALLTHFGGHTLAAGFSLDAEKIPEFRKGIADYSKTVSMPYPCLTLDCRLRPDFLNVELLDVLDTLEPFGEGNPQPVFGLFGMTLENIQPVGDGKHLRLGFSKKGRSITAMRFGTSPEQFPYIKGDLLDLAVRLERNIFRGNVSLSVHVTDLRPSGSSDDAFLSGMRLFDSVMLGDTLTPGQARLAMPDRNFIANVYRLVRASDGWRFGLDVLCMRLGDDGSCACRVAVALEALCELGILNRDAEVYALPPQTVKADLGDSNLLKRLKEAAGE